MKPINSCPRCCRKRRRYPAFLSFAAIVLIALACAGRGFSDEIHDAASKGNLETIKGLLKINPGLVLSKDAAGHTPLHLAAMEGHKDVAELLLANRADVDARTNDGETPLHLAAQEGHKDVAELLLANRADVNARDNDGTTPLHWAVSESGNDNDNGNAR